ncbi:triose-phosphate isomerase [Pelagibacterium nitratireducens]|uniref:Triosephosphate isomerase n=1 Tax=Pelagibacterium nitratireducens TaxID=1046114 RepID=A0ABZ2HUX7_9HYPH|tara:strand:- start:3371 stop:4126 length:756 start_codon:yes stop_codon:yes gene_type:complete
MQERLRPLIAGNWKMNGTSAALEQIARLKTLLGEAGNIDSDVLVCPPATLLERASQRAQGSALRIGGQDCHANPSGAHTGDVSASMLLDAGASHVIVGHSERRADHGETSETVRAKAAAALAAGLVPIICVGETEAERLAGTANQVVGEQVKFSLPETFGETPIIVAYEPVWAIGTGRTPTIDDIAQMHAHMRQLLVARFGKAGEAALLLYGGSVKPSNAEEILRTPNVNGALVGGASLLADDFFSIIVAA